MAKTITEGVVTTPPASAAEVSPPSVAKMLDDIVRFARQNAEEEGWSLADALGQHKAELAAAWHPEQYSAALMGKNYADVMWLDAAANGWSGDFAYGTVYACGDAMMMDEFDAFGARLRELTVRIAETGSLLRSR